MKKPIALAAGLLLVVAIAQVWTIESRPGKRPLKVEIGYARLADGFLHGQLSLPARPDPRLLVLTNPYDPKANAGLRLDDAVLFNGKYYIYWGPVPALLTAFFCL